MFNLLDDPKTHVIEQFQPIIDGRKKDMGLGMAET